MRTRATTVCALAVVLFARLAAAESPDKWSSLGGRWALVVENADPNAPAPHLPATASSGWGHEITITTEDGRVTIERHQFVELDVQPPMRLVYVLGEESRNVVDMGLGPQEQVARASWNGDTLVITSRHAAGTDLAAEVTQAFSIDADGALVIETTRTASGATSTTSSTTSSTTRARYRRQPPPDPSAAKSASPG
jgi:hypothetical protein